MSDNKDYETGYCKPPKATQFKKGQSGNPKGRPKGSNNLSTDVKEILKSPVPVTEDGHKRKMSTQKAMLLRLREKALKGDQKAIDRLVALAETHNNEKIADDTRKTLPQSDKKILDDFLSRKSLSKTNRETNGDA